MDDKVKRRLTKGSQMLPKWYRKEDGGKTHLFDMGSCECCGGLVEEANAVGGLAIDIPKYGQLGMREWHGPRLPECGVFNEDGDVACEFCDNHKPSTQTSFRRIKEVLECPDLMPSERIKFALKIAEAHIVVTGLNTPDMTNA